MVIYLQQLVGLFQFDLVKLNLACNVRYSHAGRRSAEGDVPVVPVLSYVGPNRSGSSGSACQRGWSSDDAIGFEAILSLDGVCRVLVQCA